MSPLRVSASLHHDSSHCTLHHGAAGVDMDRQHLPRQMFGECFFRLKALSHKIIRLAEKPPSITATLKRRWRGIGV